MSVDGCTYLACPSVDGTDCAVYQAGGFCALLADAYLERDRTRHGLHDY